MLRGSHKTFVDASTSEYAAWFKPSGEAGETFRSQFVSFSLRHAEETRKF